MLNILEYINARKIEIDSNNYKIHLATGSEISPMDAFLSGSFKTWQEHQTRKNFTKDYIISLIKINEADHRWLFAGVYKVNGEPTEKAVTGKYGDKEHFVYDTSLMPGQEADIGRIIVHYHRQDRASYLIGKSELDTFKILQILEQPYSMNEFPGFKNIDISFNVLEKIITSSFQSWYAALSSVSGVYLITDTKNKKHYVGKASGEGGIWARWSQYAQTKLGGNKLLYEEMGKTIDPIFLRFSVLEVLDKSETEENVRARESRWKNILLTRDIGYNKN